MQYVDLDVLLGLNLRISSAAPANVYRMVNLEDSHTYKLTSNPCRPLQEELKIRILVCEYRMARGQVGATHRDADAWGGGGAQWGAEAGLALYYDSQLSHAS